MYFYAFLCTFTDVLNAPLRKAEESIVFKPIQYALVAIFAAGSLAANAATREDHLAWLKMNQEATPEFAAGDTITIDNADVIRPFIPVEQQPTLIFDGMEMPIVEASDLTPRQDYLDVTVKHLGEATIASDGALENYAAGRPFDPTNWEPGSAAHGYELIWNYTYRWQFAGISVADVQWIWVRPGESHEGHEAVTTDNGAFAENYRGGGSFERLLRGSYQRVLMSHRSDLPEPYLWNDGKGFAKGTDFREYTGFDSPFDIAGTAFLILRYDDPRKTDDSWAYIPSLRRVRRISVEVKSDSLLGTDHTLEDFYGFNGRPLEHNWIYVGEARILAVNSSRYTTSHFYGPSGFAPWDNWELRDYWVINQIPIDPAHPYKEKFLYLEKETTMCFYANAYDKAGQLWKTWQMSKNWTEAPNYRPESEALGARKTTEVVRVPSFQSINVQDHQNDRGTLVPCFGNSYPTPVFRKVKRTMDVNYLTEGR